MVATPYVESFLTLSTKVNDAGLMRRRRGFYVLRIFFWTVSSVAVLAAVPLLGAGWHQLSLAAFLGLAMSQLGFISTTVITPIPTRSASTLTWRPVCSP